MRRQLLWVWGPVVLAMGLIFAVSSMPNPPEVPGDIPDVGAHGIAYAVLGVLVLRALADARWSGVTLGLAVVAAVIATAYGVSDEFHQRFVPGRTADPRDITADMVGAVVGIAVIWAWSIVLSTRRPS